MHKIKLRMPIAPTRILSSFVFIVFLLLFVFIFINELKLALILSPCFLFLIVFPACIFIATFTKCWKYDDEKFSKRRIFISKTVYYKDIDYFKNETCWNFGHRGGNPSSYKRGFFTLTNGKKIEFDISCTSKEFMKMWQKIKKSNPKAKLIEMPI